MPPRLPAVPEATTPAHGTATGTDAEPAVTPVRPPAPGSGPVGMSSASLLARGRPYSAAPETLGRVEPLTLTDSYPPAGPAAPWQRSATSEGPSSEGARGLRRTQRRSADRRDAEA